MKKQDTPKKESQNHTLTAKKVHFAYGVTESTPRAGRYDAANRPVKCKTLLKYLKELEFEKIKSYLKSRSEKIVRDFYQGDCYFLFDDAINYGSPAEPLVFLLDYIPSEVTLSILKKDNFNLLRRFLHISSMLDQDNDLTSEKKELITKKIGHIFAWNNKTITQGIKKILEDEGITESVKNCVLSAQNNTLGKQMDDIKISSAPRSI